jgi:hypothetical protein
MRNIRTIVYVSVVYLIVSMRIIQVVTPTESQKVRPDGR